MELKPAAETKWHVTEKFLSADEIELLKTEGHALRILPYSSGGRIYKIEMGGMYYATMQEMTIQ